MPKIVVDSSVWIDFLRSGSSPGAHHLEQLARSGQICLTDIIRVELLSGARHEAEYHELEDRLASLPLLEIYIGYWNEVALARFRLARRGIQAVVTDVSIAVMARKHHCALWTLDRQFAQIAKVLPFKLYSS